MDRTGELSAVVDAMRLGLEPNRVTRFKTQLSLYPETLTIRAESDEERPLLVCLHPPRLTEFQFAHRIRRLVCLDAGLAFPRGLHAQEVDLGGARTVGYAWCHYTGDNPPFRAGLAQASEYMDRVMERVLDELPVDRRAIYLLGGEGAALFASLHAVSRSETFAGVILVGGLLLPEVLADLAPETRRIPFLCIQRRRSRPQRAGESTRRIEDLRGLGFPVDLEMLTGDSEPWHEEEALVISWLSQKAGIEVHE